MKFRIINRLIVTMIFLIYFFMPVRVDAATKEVAICSVNRLNIRTNAGTEYPLLTRDGVAIQLLKNQRATVKGTKLSKDGKRWYKLKFKHNNQYVIGFAIGDFIKIKKVTVKEEIEEVDDTEENYSYDGIVRAKGLRVRVDAGTDKSQYRLNGRGLVLNENEEVVVVGEKTDSAKRRWYKIKTSIDNKKITGFALAEFIKLDLSKDYYANAEIIKKSSIVRTKATKSGNELKDKNGKVIRLKKGEIVELFHEITLSSTKYFKLSFVIGEKTLSGYVPSSDLKLVALEEEEDEDVDEDSDIDDTVSDVDIIEPDKPEITEDKKETDLPTEGGFRVQRAYITSDNVNLYNEASPNAEVLKDSETGIAYTLPMNHEVVARKEYIVGSEKWYLITYQINDSSGKLIMGAGFVPEKYIKLSGEPVEVATGSNYKELSDEEFEIELFLQGFPEDYKPFLRELHKVHPLWKFEARKLNLDWEYAVEEESKIGLNLLQNSSNIAWKSIENGAYDWSKDAFISFDAGGWVTASKDAVRYYMDPRNFLNEDYIYQFELLSYNGGYQTEEGVKAILRGSPMENMNYEYVDAFGNIRSLSYAETFIIAGIYSGVSPYHLASRVKQEVTRGGEFSSSATGKISGYEGHYNFYNIGAYNNTVLGGAILSGLKFAKNGSQIRVNVGNKSFNEYIKIPWNNRYSAILGGSAYIGYNYILRGQNTPYLEKFNFTEKNTFSHQYMSAIFSPSSESLITKRAYRELQNEPIVFSIPIFQNMPSEISKRPQDAKNPNNWLKRLEVEGAKLTPSFSSEITEGYTVVVSSDVNEITINAMPVSKLATVIGTGRFTLLDGVNEFYINVIAENGDVRTYSVRIAKEGQQ